MEKLSTAPSTYTCLVCKAGFGFDNADECTAITTPVPEYCAPTDNTAIDCNYCYDMTVNSITYTTYTTLGACCLESEVFDPTLNHCVSLNDCLSGADNTVAPNACNFCNYNKDLFVVGNMTTAG